MKIAKIMIRRQSNPDIALKSSLSAREPNTPENRPVNHNRGISAAEALFG
jgi:hypothetical protein